LVTLGIALTSGAVVGFFMSAMPTLRRWVSVVLCTVAGGQLTSPALCCAALLAVGVRGRRVVACRRRLPCEPRATTSAVQSRINTNVHPFSADARRIEGTSRSISLCTIKHRDVGQL
jgi:hypothetical protein